jgi:tRNA threonylcarbamoyladenosine biosynthesis protein TsaE
MTERQITSNSPEETFELGAALGKQLRGGEVVLLTGGLGAGKTLFTKGILSSFDFDVDEVTSPSFALVNLYRAGRFNIYHIDLWRAGNQDAAFSVGLEEIIEEDDAIVVIEWAEHLGVFSFHSPVYRVYLAGDGEEPRTITIRHSESSPAAAV